MAAADRAAVTAGTPVAELMERAGTVVADAICERYPTGPARVVCGPGDNGGDGYVVARLLAERGWTVRVEALAPPTTEASKTAAARWGGDVHPLSATADGPALIVDALFGAGLSRPLDGDAARLARACERMADRVVAVDVPSGLAADLARPLGEGFCADLTVTFHARKLGHVLEPGRSRCGEVLVGDIGLAEASSTLFENGPALWLRRFPWPSASSHKHARGRMIVISGEPWSTGAARLAARSGLRIGAGVVTLFSSPDALRVNAAHLEAVMLRPFETDLELEQAAADVDVAVIGPAAGVTETTLVNLLALARTGAALVIDADAITVFKDDRDELFSVLDRDDVLTPHPGEFERLFPGLLAAGPNRVAAARKAAELAGAVVLLKGPDTVIAAPDGRAAVNMNGSRWLATAGAGDVLAGFIGGLVAQGMESFEAACAAAWIHAEAASHFGPGLTAEDLPGLAPPVLAELWRAAGEGEA